MANRASEQKNGNGKRLLHRQVRNWKRTLVVTLVLFALLAAGLTALAEYTRASWARRVVGAYEASGSLFSSNYLLSGESIQNRRTIFVNDANASLTAAVTICNYAQGNPGKHYGRNISYTLQWRLVTISGGNTVPYTDSGSLYTDASVSKGTDQLTAGADYSYVLSGEDRAQNTFLLIFDKDMINPAVPVYLEVVATPTAGYIDLPQKLTALFEVAVRSVMAEASWSGSFSDSKAGKAPTDYDGFNYTLMGSGKGTCTLSWDPSLLAISQVSLQTQLGSPSVTTAGNGWPSIQLAVDSDVQDRYDLQFYWAGSDRVDLWASLENGVLTSFTPAESEAESEPEPEIEPENEPAG